MPWDTPLKTPSAYLMGKHTGGVHPGRNQGKHTHMMLERVLFLPIKGKGYAPPIDRCHACTYQANVVSPPFFLEVIDTNERAKKLYLSHGFYYHEKPTLLPNQERDAGRHILCPVCRKQERIKIPSGDCIPSWQNSDACISRGGFTAYDIVHDSVKRGVICFNHTKGFNSPKSILNHNTEGKDSPKQAIIAAKKLYRNANTGNPEYFRGLCGDQWSY